MKFLLYGTKGWIGQKFLKYLIHENNENNEIIIGKARVDNIKDVEDEIINIKPTHVISTIGRTHGEFNNKVYGTIDYLEQPGKLVENVRDNLFGPIILAQLAIKHNFHNSYLGTGCIFEFDDLHPFGIDINGFTEESLPNFFGSSYSIVKGYTDQLMHLMCEKTLNIRIRMPITDEFNSRNFITKITNYPKICSVPNSMTVLDELIPIMIDMAKNNKTGTINMTNPGLITHNEILEMYKEIVDPTFKWNNFTIDEQRIILDSGRSNNYLDSKKLELLYPNVKNIKDSVRETLIRMACKK
jgi:nucleoside-diphosphate-sugar epimerase